jgi:hypothetical protein
MRIGSVLLLALPLLSLAELTAHRHFRKTAPTSDDWQNLEPVVGQMRHASELVVVSPAWAEPLLRQALGDRLMPIELLARADDETLGRAIEVSFGSAQNRRFATWREIERKNSGPFLLRVLENPQTESVRTRLIDWVHPPDLQVFEGPQGDPQACSFTTRGRVSTGGLGGDPTLGAVRYACPSGEPYIVTVTTIDDQDFLPRRCIWAHPTPLGPLTLLFRNVWLGTKLVGHAGLPWLISRDGVGTPVRLEAKFEGTLLGRVVIEDTEGWMRFEWATTSNRDQHGDLELVVSSERPDNRRFCFTLESR